MQGDGPDWLCFNGEIRIDGDVKIGGFKASGLSVRVSDACCLFHCAARHANDVSSVSPFPFPLSPVARRRSPPLQDFIELTMIPPDPAKAPFNEMRLVIPVRLTTDAYSADGSHQAAIVDFSPPSTPPEAQTPRSV